MAAVNKKSVRLMLLVTLQALIVTTNSQVNYMQSFTLDQQFYIEPGVVSPF